MTVTEFVAERRRRLASALGDLRSDVGAWPVTAMTLLCLALGLWLRARGFFYDVPAMWTDECTWTTMLEELPLSELLIRPPGFMLVSKVVVSFFEPTETPLRAMPWIASVATMMMAPFLGRRLFRAPAARLLFVAVIALHPCATDFAKEFKPYSMSIALHVGLTLLTLRFVESKRTRDLVWLLTAAVVGTLFAQDAIFAFPAIFAIAGWEAFKHNRKGLAPIAIAAGLIVLLLLGQYYFIWRNLPKGESDYWAGRYNVFYMKESGDSFLEWFRKRYEQMAVFPGYHRLFWRGSIPGDERQNVRDMAHYVWLFLHVAGIVFMFWRKRFREAALLLTPLVVLIAFNLAGFWPLGAFRTNLFLIWNTAGIAAMALDESVPKRRPIGATVPAGLLIVIPLLFFEDEWPPTKRALTFISEYPALLGWLAERAPEPPAERQKLILGRGTCACWKYFLKYHPKTRPLRARLEAGFEPPLCLKTKEELDPTLNRVTTSSTQPTWLVRGLKEPQSRDPELRRLEFVIVGLQVVGSYVRKLPGDSNPSHSQQPSE